MQRVNVREPIFCWLPPFNVLRRLSDSIFNIAIGKLRLLFSFSKEKLVDELHPFIRCSETVQGEIAASNVLLSGRCQVKKTFKCKTYASHSLGTILLKNVSFSSHCMFLEISRRQCEDKRLRAIELPNN